MGTTMKIHSETAWNIASQWHWALGSDTRTLATQIDVAISEARAAGVRDGLEAVIAVATDYANDAMPESEYRRACIDIADTTRAAMEPSQ